MTAGRFVSYIYIFNVNFVASPYKCNFVSLNRLIFNVAAELGFILNLDLLVFKPGFAEF